MAVDATGRDARPARPARVAAVAGAAALWAIAAVVARTLFDAGLDPLELTAARSWIAAIGLGLLAASWRRGRAGAGTRTLVLVVLLGFSIALVNAAYYLAIRRLDVAVALVLQYTAPAMVVAWAAAVLRRAPPPQVLAALVASGAGIVLVSGLLGAEVLQVDEVGLALGLSAAVLFASYTIVSERLGAVYGVQGALFRGFLAASACWIVFQAFRGSPAGLFRPENVPAVLFVGVAGTLVPFVLYLWGIQQVQSERAAIAATLEPVLAGAIAWVWLGQDLTPLQILGALLVIGAVVALQARSREPLVVPER